MKLFIFLTAMILVNTFFKDKLTGRLETKPSAKGNVTGVIFREDHTYVAYINGKPFVNGVYTLKDSLVIIKESQCDKTGIYKLLFFSNNDSLRFQLVMDSCVERSQGMIRTILGRVKQS